MIPNVHDAFKTTLTSALAAEGSTSPDLASFSDASPYVCFTSHHDVLVLGGFLKAERDGERYQGIKPP